MAERQRDSLEAESNDSPYEEEGCDSGVSEYEKQRMNRIAENKARMKSLGIRPMAASLVPSSSQKEKFCRSRTKYKEESIDKEYVPTESDDEEDDDSEFDDSKTRRKEVKKEASKVKNKRRQDRCTKDLNEDEQMMQAIAISCSNFAKKAGNENADGNGDNQASRKARKKIISFNSRVKMTEDELIMYFFQFDDGNGHITLREMQSIATAHDFTWSKKELADMIHFFASQEDGKLTLNDFREIVSRCNMIQGDEPCANY